MNGSPTFTAREKLLKRASAAKYSPSLFLIMSKLKVTLIVFLCLAVASAVGVFLSHVLYVFFSKNIMRYLNMSLMVDALNDAGGDIRAASNVLKNSLAVGLGLGALLGTYIGFKLIWKERSLYGRAKFATKAEIKAAGFFTPKDNALIVGKVGKDYLHYGGQQFAILAAPTRSGKGVGIVIPNLLTYKESVVVLDIKQENFSLTSGFRQAYGHEVFLFNPFAEDGRTHRWNPLTYITSDVRGRVSDIMSIALMLYPVGADGKDQFWKGQAQNVFLALVLFLLEYQDHQRELGCPESSLNPVCIGAVLQLSTADGVPLAEHITALSERSVLSQQAKTAFSGLLANNEETFASIMGTFKEPLLPWLNPVVNAATAADDFLLTDVRKKKMTVYIGILPNKIADAKLIVNLFFSQLINENTRQLPQENPELKHQCLLLMDEFTTLGRVEIIAKSLSYIAGYNLRLFPIIQSIAQLDSTYGKDDSRTMLTNHALQILYTPRAQSDANDYSEMLGYESVKKTSKSYAREKSKSVNEEKRALMLPQELKAMSNDSEIIIFEGMSNPIMCSKIKYYKDKNFTSRLQPAVHVPTLAY
jgi:type IV secretion system protein VirD4